MAALLCHPEFRSDAVSSLEARITRRSKELAVTYLIEGHIERLRIPPPRAPRFADGLWRHTCCEIFIARPGMPAYHEFNFSPSGEWAAYAFSTYRNGALLSDEALDPRIEVRTSADGFKLDAVIGCDPGKIAVGLSAVVEELDGSISYWALRHAPGKPDFHHSDAFALELA